MPSARVAVGAWCVALVLASVIPIPGSSGSPSVLPFSPTAPFHLVGYGVLGALTIDAVGPRRGAMAFAALFAMSVGAGIEVLQVTIPWRTFAIADLAINALGAVAGVSIRSIGRGNKS